MGSFLEEYTNRVTVELHGQPDAQFVLQWNGGQKRLELLVTFNVEKLLEEFAAQGHITIKTMPSSRNFSPAYATIISRAYARRSLPRAAW